MKDRIHLLSLLGVLSLSLFLVGCGDDDNDDDDNGSAAAFAPSAGAVTTSGATSSLSQTAPAGATPNVTYTFAAGAGTRFQTDDGQAGNYQYTHEGDNSARLRLTYDDGTEEDINLTFTSAHAGQYTGQRTPAGGGGDVALAGTFDNFMVNEDGGNGGNGGNGDDDLAPSATQVDATGAMFNSTTGAGTSQVVLFQSGNAAQDGTFWGTWEWVKNDSDTATATITLQGGGSHTITLDFTDANSGTVSGSENGTFSGFELNASGTGDGAPGNGGNGGDGPALSSLHGQILDFVPDTGGGGFSRQFTATTSNGQEAGEFFDPGQAEVYGDYTYQVSGSNDAMASLVINYAADSGGGLEDETDDLTLTFSTTSSGTYTFPGFPSGTFTVR